MCDYQIADSDSLVQCPYDKAHMVSVKRLQYHLMKCRKNHKDGREFGVCPYNATHEMAKPELRHHMTVCPDRAIVEKTLRYEAAKNTEDGMQLKGCTDVPAYHSYELKSDENWDAEVPDKPRMGVDPSFFHKQTRRSLAGMTPLEKRQFHSALVPDVDDLYHQERTGPVGMVMKEAPKKEKPAVRLPSKKSQAEVYFESQQKKIPTQTSAVFQYSLTMAGVGRGGGVVPIQPPVQVEPIVQSRPHGLQHHSQNTGQSNNIDPPESIRPYLFVPGQRRNRHNNNNNRIVEIKSVSENEDSDGIDSDTNGRVTPELISGASSNASSRSSGRTRGAGRGRQSPPIESFNPPIGSFNQAPVVQQAPVIQSAPVIHPSLSMAGIGRGERLENGFPEMKYVSPPISTSWASYLTESTQNESTRDEEKLCEPVLNDLSDFPMLGGSKTKKSNKPTILTVPGQTH